MPPRIKSKDSSSLTNTRELLLDPWGDCHGVTAHLHDLEEPVRTGPSSWMQTIKKHSSGEAWMAMEEIRNSNILVEYQKAKGQTWWQTRKLGPEETFDQMIRHATLYGGDPAHRLIWRKRWLASKEQPFQSLLDSKKGVTLVNMDIDPREEKREWIKKTKEQNPEKKIIAFGIRQDQKFPALKHKASCVDDTPGKSMHGKRKPVLRFWSTHPFPHQPYLIET